MISVDILDDTTGLALAKANNNHCTGFMERDYTLVPKELEPVTKRNNVYFMYHSKIPHPMMNSVMFLDRNTDFPDISVKEIAEFFRNRGYPQLWWLGELSTPSGVGKVLVECGLEKMEWESPVMAADLTSMDFSKLDVLEETKNILVKRVTTSEDLAKWLSVTQEIYNYPDSFISALGHIYRIRMTEKHSSPIQNFIAERHNEPIGMSSLYLSEGLAGLYYVGTKKEFRGQGVGSAVTLAAMKKGRDAGYEVGVLGSSQLGYSVYQSVGFKEYYKWQVFVG